MNYQIGDILECVDTFNTNESYILWDVRHKFSVQYPGRIISKGDIYKVSDLEYINYDKLYIYEITKGVKYNNVISVSTDLVDKYFKCKRIERLNKLTKLNNI